MPNGRFWLDLDDPCCKCVKTCKRTALSGSELRCTPPSSCTCGIPELVQVSSNSFGYRCPPTRCCWIGWYIYENRHRCKPHCNCGTSFEHNDKYICPLCECEETCVNWFTLRRESCGSCFPSSATVNLENGKSRAMSDLQIGDKVQTGISFTTIIKIKHIYLTELAAVVVCLSLQVLLEKGKGVLIHQAV